MKDKATGKERLYMAVTKDRLSLPLAVADSAAAERGKERKYTVLDFQMEKGDSEMPRIYRG